MYRLQTPDAPVETALGQGGTRVTAPNPAALPALLEAGDVDQKRNFFCSCYDDCLDFAIMQSWPSWTCESCKLSSLPSKPYAVRAVEGARLRPLADHRR